MSDLAPGINLRLHSEGDGASTFVEIEDDHGRGVKVGTMTRGDDGDWCIRITAADVAKQPAPAQCAARTPTKFQFQCVHRAGHDCAHRADLGNGTYSWHDDVQLTRVGGAR